MQHKADNDNNARPAEFDAAVMRYLPMLRAKARILVKHDKREELVQETITRALERWRNFRGDNYGSGGGMHTWLVYLIRDLARAENDSRQPPFVDIDEVHSLSTPAPQEHAIELKRVLKGLKRMRAKVRNPVLLTAAGHTHTAIGRKYGVTNQAISMRVQRARLELAS